jgi:hypothetical protein
MSINAGPEREATSAISVKSRCLHRWASQGSLPAKTGNFLTRQPRCDESIQGVSKWQDSDSATISPAKSKAQGNMQTV